MHSPGTPLPHYALKNTLLKPIEEFRVFWPLAAWTPCLTTCNKRCTFLHHNSLSVDWPKDRWADPSLVLLWYITASSNGPSFHSVYLLMALITGHSYLVYSCFTCFVFWTQIASSGKGTTCPYWLSSTGHETTNLSQGVMKLKFFMSQHKRNYVRGKVIERSRFINIFCKEFARKWGMREWSCSRSQNIRPWDGYQVRVLGFT